jgi:hypothetical protein
LTYIDILHKLGFIITEDFMERSKSTFGLGDHILAQRQRPTFLDGINAMITWGALRSCFYKSLEESIKFSRVQRLIRQSKCSKSSFCNNGMA